MKNNGYQQLQWDCITKIVNIIVKHASKKQAENSFIT